jgi:two-component system, chemotaxis family, chemotaxis protein CheY
MVEPPPDLRPLVLIVDEDQTARDLYGHWFADHGFQIMCAVGVSGLAMALRRERPRLVVTEMRARDLSVSDLITRLRCLNTTRYIPVLVVTSSCDPSAHEAAKAAGAVAVLPKWVNFDGLHSWVVALSDESHSTATNS